MTVRIESHAEPIPGYRLIERLGGGGFGEVWKAEAPGGLHKAIKFVYGDLETADEDGHRAEQELKALSRVKTVRHPYILSLERFDIVDGQLLIVMELADRNLWDRFRECRALGLPGIPREELLRYMQEAAEALDLMNTEHQLQHLDIKPQNLFLVHNHAKVADFGLVKDLEGMMASVTGGVTPVYAAPETFDGWVSRFCDQYSLAIVYQELLTGQRPFNGTNVRQLIVQHLQAQPDLSSLPVLDRGPIGKALSKNPDERYPSCREFIGALQGGAGPAAQAPDQKSPERTPAQGDKKSGERPLPPSEALFRPPDETPREERPDTGRITQVVVAEPSPINGAAEPHRIIAHIGDQPSEEVLSQLPVSHDETRGAGVLFPALVIGIGQHGLRVLQRLRRKIEDQFGHLDALPNLRLLYLDTDADSARAAAEFRPSEVLLTRLNRPRHYLRAQTGRPNIDTWFDLKMLYRIPRSLVTMGMRALGRLAFVDNYRLITRRLKSTLADCTNAETLAAAAKETGLGMRTDHPHVYVITGLGGGTGSGMFLDLAYVVRHLLRRMGYERPETSAIFLLPAADRQPNRTLAMGNAYAALTELNHFSSPETIFSARYEEHGKAIQDPEAPFTHCTVLELPQGSEERGAQETIEMAADALCYDLISPLGREVENARARLCQAPQQMRGLCCRAFGLYRISLPRKALTQSAARRLCKQIVGRWLNKDAKPIRERIQAAVHEVWTQDQLGGEALMATLQKACDKVVGQPVEAALAAAVEDVTQLDAERPELLPPALAATIERIESIVGRPDSSAGSRVAMVIETLAEMSEKAIADWGKLLADFALSLIEHPEARLAGAEETVRQFIANIEEVLLHYEPLCKELTTRAGEAYDRLRQLMANTPAAAAGTRRAGNALSHLFELLQAYTKWRYQSLVVQRLIGVYISLRGSLSDQLREINFCRTRLVELQRNFDRVKGASEYIGAWTFQREIFPAGCPTLDAAVEQFAGQTAPEDLQELDRKVQYVIQQKFAALLHVCLSSANLLQDLEMAMQQEVEGFVSERLASHDVAALYLEGEERELQAPQDLVTAFDEAVPELAGSLGGQNAELCVLGTPPGGAGERIRELTRKQLADVALVDATTQDDILLYREFPQLPLTSLAQLGSAARQAYVQVCGAEHYTAHSRTDIVDWRGATTG
jgi:eukaryotic-like serine/threonine-protein kinase